MIDYQQVEDKLWSILSLLVDHFHNKLENNEDLSGYEVDSLLKLLRLNNISVQNIHSRTHLSESLEQIQGQLLELPSFK